MAHQWGFGIFTTSYWRFTSQGIGSLVRPLNAGLETGYGRFGVWRLENPNYMYNFKILRQMYKRLKYMNLNKEIPSVV